MDKLDLSGVHFVCFLAVCLFLSWGELKFSVCLKGGVCGIPKLCAHIKEFWKGWLLVPTAERDKGK